MKKHIQNYIAHCNAVAANAPVVDYSSHHPRYEANVRGARPGDKIRLESFTTFQGIYYSDTDSLFLDAQANKRLLKRAPELIGTGLGQLNLENEIESAVFILPKFYMYKTAGPKGKSVLKGKGIPTNLLTEDHYHSLLNNETIHVPVTKWFRDLAHGCVRTRAITLSVSPRLTKRHRVYNESGAWFDTAPLTVRNGVVEEPQSKIYCAALRPRPSTALVRFIPPVEAQLRRYYAEECLHSLLSHLWQKYLPDLCFLDYSTLIRGNNLIQSMLRIMRRIASQQSQPLRCAVSRKTAGLYPPQGPKTRPLLRPQWRLGAPCPRQSTSCPDIEPRK